MIRYLKQYLAIRSYVQRLSNELRRRFNKRPYYSIDQVTQAVRRGKFSEAFIIYAHATFCNLPDFCAHYPAADSAANYQKFRRTVSKRYLAGQLNFDAETIIEYYHCTGYPRGDFHESGTGTGGADIH